eukprot:403377217
MVSKFKYCRAKEYYVDPSSNASNIELGTLHYPFKALDDPFREIFNYAAQYDETFKIYLKHGPYYEILINSQNEAFKLTDIKIYQDNYYRSPSDFNPTISSTDSVTQPYNLDLRISQGLLPASAKTSTKYKFMTYDASLIVSGFNFTEVSFLDTTTNSLFFPTFGAYRWINVTNCYFLLEQQLAMTLEGANIKIENSTVDVSIQNRISIYQSYSVCSAYDHYGIANNYIWINNVFTGFNVGGYTSFIYGQNHCNFTMLNNKFVDVKWIASDISISIEHNTLKCPKEPYTVYDIQNNTLVNTDQVRLSYIFFTLKFQEDGIQNVIFKGNTFINASYYTPGIFVVYKFNMKNLMVTYENNYYQNVYNDLQESPVAYINAPIFIASNNTIINSRVPTFLSIKTYDAKIQEIKILNVSSLGNILSIIYDFQMIQVRRIR